MRVFVAIDPPAEIRHALAATRGTLSAGGDAARWVAPEAIHITLRFIGEISAERVDAVDRALAGIRWTAFTIAVRGLGFFPGKRRPRVLWAGLVAEDLAPLAAKVEAALQQIGFAPEGKPFRPHITLARSKERGMTGALVASVQDMADSDFGSFVADRFYLVASVLQAGGSVYTKIREYKAA